MHRSFYTQGEWYVVTTGALPTSGASDPAPISAQEAGSLLNSHDPSTLGQLSCLQQELTPWGERSEDQPLVDWALAALDEGILTIFRESQTAHLNVTRALAQRERAVGEALLESRVAWIEVVVDSDDEHEVLEGLAFELVLADGSLRTGTLDAQGRARVDGIPAGICELDFVELAADEWYPR